MSLPEAIALADPDKVDVALVACLPPSVTSACQAKWIDIIGEYGWEGVSVGYDLIALPPTADVEAALAALRAAMRPASGSAIKAELARLRVTTISRATEQSDLTLTFAAYAESLAEYPADVAIEACRFWSRNEKWWPSLSELRSRMDQRARRRRSLLAALEQAQHRAAA